MAELLAARDAVTGADMVELRLDGVGDVSVRAALNGRSLPVIATCRPTWEGGKFDGDAGLPTRLLASRFGSPWTYAGSAVAPGQIPASRMLEEFRFRTVGAGTAIYGVVGNHVMHSMSPVMHNAAFEAAGLDAVYVPLRAADVEDFLAFADAMHVEGASVTIPFKLDALRAASYADALTRAVGAANTLRRTDVGWDAANSDVQGFLDPLEAVYPGSLKGARAAVLGAGRAATARPGAPAPRAAALDR